jgi:hypothetical protein
LGVAAVGRWEMRPRVWAEPCVRGRPKDGRGVGLEKQLAACSTKSMQYNSNECTNANRIN